MELSRCKRGGSVGLELLGSQVEGWGDHACGDGVFSQGRGHRKGRCWDKDQELGMIGTMSPIYQVPDTK